MAKKREEEEEAPFYRCILWGLNASDTLIYKMRSKYRPCFEVAIC